MSVQLSLHFRYGLRVIHAGVHPNNRFATITLGENGDDPANVFPAHPEMYFSRPEDISTLVAALVKLGGELAAAQEQPATVDDAVVPLDVPPSSLPATDKIGPKTCAGDGCDRIPDEGHLYCPACLEELTKDIAF